MKLKQTQSEVPRYHKDRIVWPLQNMNQEFSLLNKKYKSKKAEFLSFKLNHIKEK